LLNPFAAPSWLPQTDLIVESASSVILSSPLSFNHWAFYDNNNFSDIAFSNIALSNFKNASTETSPLGVATPQIRLIPLIEDSVIDNKIWLIPNFPDLYNTVEKVLPKTFTMF
jgi:hypothetical protein